MQDLAGKVIWITGAGSGIGRAAAQCLAAAGAHLILSGRRAEALKKTCGEIESGTGEILAMPLDVADADAVSQAAARILEQFGRIDVLVNNAGINVAKRHYNETSLEDWRRIIDINLNGAFYCTAAVLPAMRAQKDGLIINVSSWAGRHDSYVAGPAYGASKHAMRSMNATLNIAEGMHGIRACCICPAEVATEILDQRPVPVSREDRARMLQAEDLGETVLYVVRMPANACVNEILISPTWNRANYAAIDRVPPLPDS